LEFPGFLSFLASAYLSITTSLDLPGAFNLFMFLLSMSKLLAKLPEVSRKALEEVGHF
jgi:hypothetical protein